MAWTHGRPPYRAEVLRHDPLPRRSALARSEHSPTRRERVARSIIFWRALEVRGARAGVTVL